MSVILVALYCLHAWHTTALCCACDGALMNLPIEFHLKWTRVFCIMEDNHTGRTKRVLHNTGVTILVE